MTPTRELALQIFRECKKFCKPLNLRVVCVYGGTGISEQVRAVLSPKSDQHQISPYSINTEIKREGNENQGRDHQIDVAMIFNKSSQLVPYENVWMPHSLY